MRSILPLIAVLLLFGSSYARAQDFAVPGEAINVIVREGGSPADIVLGGGMAPWMSDKAGWLGEWITGLPSSKARQYRAALRDVFLDAQGLGPYEASLVEGLDSFWTNEMQTAVILINWNENLDRTAYVDRQSLSDPILGQYVGKHAQDDLAAIQRARAHLPSAESLRVKMKRLERLPGVLLRGRQDWLFAIGPAYGLYMDMNGVFR
ncbi:hypothetical protein [Mesorhizobium sophorae]|uniref:hypothetical protein n=1 Tax=Mesorhizobium sophorae TaxID=1300294 RepID=UPI00117E712A|nr:hypothetical protein [Mesorhizobium sophorae]